MLRSLILQELASLINSVVDSVLVSGQPGLNGIHK